MMLFAAAALDVQFSIVLLHDFTANPEAKADAGGFLGGEEGFERALFCGTIHSGASVGDSEADADAAGFAVVGFTNAEHEARAGRVPHGVNGVIDEVRDDLANFTWKAEEWMMRLEAALQFNPDVAQARLMQ